MRDKTGNRPIEQMKIPLGIAATDLDSGEGILFRRGDTGTAVRASSAVPAVFQPVRIGPREYVDGGLSAPVPVHHARAMGAEFVIAVDISAVPQGQPTSDLARMLMQTFAIMGRSIKGYELRDADLVLRAEADRGRRHRLQRPQALDPGRPRGGAGADRRAARAAGGQGPGAVVAGMSGSGEAPQPVTLRQASLYWLKLGCISFGGPAGQIAIMHEELVERRRWISEHRFLHALNYCMVLPGPEAQQLATYIGWLMHRTWGGLVAGDAVRAAVAAAADRAVVDLHGLRRRAAGRRAVLRHQAGGDRDRRPTPPGASARGC